MNLTEILESLKLGKISTSKAKKLLSLYSVEKIEDFAKLDVGRKFRRGMPEVVFAEKKTIDEIKKIIQSSIHRTGSVIVSRVNENHYDKILLFTKKKKFKTKVGKNTTTILVSKNFLKKSGGHVGILTAGTSDISVAEEAKIGRAHV